VGEGRRLKTFPVKFIILFYVCINYEGESGQRSRGRHSENAGCLSSAHIHEQTRLISHAVERKKMRTMARASQKFFSLGKWR
jgi:hypothetical protein